MIKINTNIYIYIYICIYIYIYIYIYIIKKIKLLTTDVSIYESSIGVIDPFC